MAFIKHKTIGGNEVEFEDSFFAQGGMKDVHWGKDKTYVVAFYRDKQDANSLDRIKNITETFRKRIFNMEGGDYWKDLLVWPYDTIDYNGKTGIVCPVYKNNFFFKYGSVNNDMLGIKGIEKGGKWFTSASNQNRFLDEREKGNWRSYFRISILLSRAIKRLHSAGLAHSDLSNNNVLVDPEGGNACIIDNDSLVVPGKYPPDVVGTPDFIAPEVMSTRSLKVGDSNKNLPNINTDKHALAVLIYMYLFYRHPLRGGKVHDLDPQKDEELSMGLKAVFIEHPKDKSNRPNLNDVKKSSLPWADINQIPYTVAGPYLKELFDRSFITCLHSPARRPIANEWEIALVKTLDLMQPCLNTSCSQKWFVFDNTKTTKCPFCKTPYNKKLPILNLYSSKKAGKYLPDNHRIMVYHNQYLYKWHVDRTIFPNERLESEDKKPVGYFVFHQNKWLFINQTLTKLKNISQNKIIPIGDSIELEEGIQILFSDQATARLAAVQMVN
jgi:serine/threonine protein kinase